MIKERFLHIFHRVKQKHIKQYHHQNHGPILDQKHLQDHFPNIQNRLNRHNLKLGRDPLPVSPATHYIVGDYWYTSDLIEEFDSVSTGMHKKNAGIALITQLLTSSLDSESLHTLFADLSNNKVYSVQNHDGGPGDLITRDHEIRYLGIDSKLYPRGGLYSSEYSGGNPTGIDAPIAKNILKFEKILFDIANFYKNAQMFYHYYGPILS